MAAQDIHGKVKYIGTQAPLQHTIEGLSVGVLFACRSLHYS